MQRTRCLALLAVLTTVSFISAAGTACVCPEQCDCLQEGTIDCANRRLQSIPAAINCTWPNVTTINLKQNQIEQIPEYAFSQLLQLERLYIFDNLIEVINVNAFFNLTDLQYLYLDGNRLRVLPDEVFFPLRNLQRLYLYSNQISYLPIDVFSRLRNLQRLALHDNALTILDARSFNGLVNLEELFLSDNEIIGLSNSPFTFLNELRRLFLSNNNLTRLTRFDFVGANRLLTVDLNNNRISLIDDETFLLHPDIKELFIGNNLLSRITRLTFAGILNLRTLHLPGNIINYISEGAFFRNSLLSEIILSRNQMEELHPNVLAGLRSLAILWMDDNRLTYLVHKNFIQAPLLQLLVLNRNLISCIESDTFNGVRLLVHLDLGRNALSFLPENVFQFTPNLLYLLLHGNEFTVINNRPFRNLHRLIQLSLNDNAISYITEGALDGTDNLFYFHWNRDSDFDLDNRLMCDCSSLWLYHYVRRSFIIDFSILCAGPPPLKSRDITALSPQDFDCESLSVESLQVHAGPSCDNHVVNEGSCLRLSCTSTPNSHTSWSRVDNKPTTDTPHTCRSFSTCVPEGGGSELVIEDMSEDHEGTYLCTASLLNVTTAVACRVSLGKPPSVLLRPDDQFLHNPGETAFFRVQVSGQPHPSVEWYHDAVTRTSKLVKEDKRHVISASGSLVVMDTQLEEQGTYRGIFSNGAGTETVEASLEFFFTSPCRQECQNGGTCYGIHYCYCHEDFVGRHCEMYTGSPTDHPPGIDDGSTPDTGVLVPYSGSGGYSGSGSGSGSGSERWENEDGANFYDDEDLVDQNNRYRRRDRVKMDHSPYDPTFNDGMSPWNLAGKRFQSLLWEMSSEERRFEMRLKEAKELRELKKSREEGEIGRFGEREGERREGEMRESEGDLGKKREGVRGEMVRRAEEEWSGGEGGATEIGEWDEVEWEQAQRKIFLELGLATEWNEDGHEEGRGNGEHEEAPTFMDLKLLPANHLHNKHVTHGQFPDLHMD